MSDPAPDAERAREIVGVKPRHGMGLSVAQTDALVARIAQALADARRLERERCLAAIEECISRFDKDKDAGIVGALVGAKVFIRALRGDA
jgi:hypothetical protein